MVLAMSSWIGRAQVSIPALIVVVALGYLVLAWASFFLIDVYNVLGSRDALEARMTVPKTWVHLFREGNPTEWLQWTALGATALVSARLGGRLAAAGQYGAASFWAIFGVAAVLMLIEDAGNPRHRLANYGESMFGVPSTATELVYFAALASVPLYALLRYGRHVWSTLTTRRYLIAGVVFYGIAGGASGTRAIGSWYTEIGTAFDQRLLGGRLLRWDFLGESTGFWLMDWLVEESLELMGAACLCAAAVACLTRSRSVRGNGDAAHSGMRQADRYSRRADRDDLA